MSSRARHHVQVWSLRIAIVIAFGLLWQTALWLDLADPVLVGTPMGSLVEFFRQLGTDIVWVHLPYTLYETFVGFLIAVTTGFTAGVALSRMATTRKAIAPIITSLNSLPRVALAPLFILWFGLGATGKIALVVSFVFFVMLTTTVAAFTQANGDFELLARSMGLSTRQEILWFSFPAAVPTLIAGLELSLVYSFLAAVSGEIVGGSKGLGVQLMIFANSFQLDRFMAILLLLIVVSTVPVVIMRGLTSRLTSWHEAERGDIS